MNAGNGGGPSNDLPWASIFDSAANMRALSAIQADGLRAASELVDRFVQMASTTLNGYGQSTESAAVSSAEHQADLFGATGLEPFVTSWWAMVDQFLKMSTPRAEQPAATASPALDLSTAVATGCLHLEAVSPGAATAEMWLHNGGSVDLGKIRLRSSDLLSHNGSVLAAELLRFEPDVVVMPSRSSRGVTMAVEIIEGTVPGSYRGMVLADGHPEVWLPVELVVEPLLP